MLAKQGSSSGKRAPQRRSRGRPRLDQVADLERELLDVALNEFLRDGYGGASMANIVKAAGVSKTTLYSRFSSKDELFLAIIEKMLDVDLTEKLKSLNESPAGLEEKLKTFAGRAAELALHPLFLGLIRLIYAEAHRFHELQEIGERLAAMSIAAVERFITDCAVSEGIPCRDPRLPAEALVQMLRGYQLDAIMTNQPPSKEEIRKWVDDRIDLLLASRKHW